MSLIDDIIDSNGKLGMYGNDVARIYAQYYRFEKLFSMSRLFQSEKFIKYTNKFSSIKKSDSSKEHVLKRINDFYLDEFNKADEREKVLLYFAYIKRVDELLDDEEGINTLRYATYDGDEVAQYGNMFKTKGNKGILIIGKRVWSERRFTEGNCPFNNIRFIVLSATEYSPFINYSKMTRDVCIFYDDENCGTDVLVSHSNNDYNYEIGKERKLVHNNWGFKVSINQPTNNSTSDAISEAIEYCTDSTSILVFPEIMINQSELKEVINTLNKNSQKLQNVKLAVIGSYKEKEIGYDNLAIVLVNRDKKWEILTEYKKIIPSSVFGDVNMSEKYGIKTNITDKHIEKVVKVEDLNNANMNEDISLIVCKDCIIGIAICRDALDILNLDSPLHRYTDTIDLLVVISLNSADTNMFMGSAECLSRWHNCGVVYTNNIICCKSDKKLIEVSFALTPYKNIGDAKHSIGTTALTGAVCYRNCIIKPQKDEQGKAPIVYNEIDSNDTVAIYTLSKNKEVICELPKPKFIMQISDNSQPDPYLEFEYKYGYTWGDAANDFHLYDDDQGYIYCIINTVKYYILCSSENTLESHVKKSDKIQNNYTYRLVHAIN